MTQSLPRECPCGSVEYRSCCGRFIDAGELPSTAERLMRSRYTAFVLGDEGYLRDTWHPETRPSRVRFDEQQRWLGLKIKRTEAGTAEDAQGVVEFVARFKVQGRGHRLHEVSRFEKVEGRWYYLDGQHL